MTRHVSSSKSRRTAAPGPSIQWLDGDDPPSADGAPAKRTSSGGSGVRILPAPARAKRPGWVSLTVLLVSALGFTAAGVVYVSGRLAADEPDRVAVVEDIEPIAQAPPEVAPVVPPPSDAELAALESGAEAAMGDALRALRKREVTPAGLRAAAIASGRTTDVELQRRATCYRVRGGAPLEEAFSALPATPADDFEWTHDGAACLVEAIAARASEAPERALPVLLDRAFVEDADPIVEGLAQLNVPVLPVSVAAALNSPGHVRTRRTAIRVAIALGAAAKWPEQAARWLEDRDRTVRLFAHAELLRRRDDASRRLAARAIAASPADDELSRRAIEQIAKGDGFDRQLAEVAADASQPAAVRAHAAGLVGTHGGPAACRVVIAIASAEPALASELAETRLRIDRRFGATLRRPVRR